jgi:hypothetical protein
MGPVTYVTNVAWALSYRTAADLELTLKSVTVRLYSVDGSVMRTDGDTKFSTSFDEGFHAERVRIIL